MIHRLDLEKSVAGRRVGQPKRHSHMEALCGIGIGFCVAVPANWLLMPIVGTTFGGAIALTLAMTVLSYTNRYFTRRFFNWYLHRDQP